MPELKVLSTVIRLPSAWPRWAKRFNRDYAGQSVILLGVLKGRRNLSQRLGAACQDLDATFDFIGVSSYGNRPGAAQGTEDGNLGFDR